MRDARVGRSGDKERSIQKHGKDTARVYALGSMKFTESEYRNAWLSRYRTAAAVLMLESVNA
jgi:hypothetical protein